MERKVSESGSENLTQPLLRFGVPASLAHDLVRGRFPVQYGKGSMIFLQHSPADLLFLVEAGVVKICSPAADGSRYVVHIAGPGEVLGYVSIGNSVAGEVQAFEAEALTRCSVVPIPREHVRQALGKLDLAEMIKLTEEANRAWASIFANFVRCLNSTFRERLENVLRDLAARFGVPHTRGIPIPLKLSHEDFAELIGSSRPMASRLLSEMMDEGMLLREDGRYVLLAPGHLRARPGLNRFGGDGSRP